MIRSIFCIYISLLFELNQDILISKNNLRNNILLTQTCYGANMIPVQFLTWCCWQLGTVVLSWSKTWDRLTFPGLNVRLFCFICVQSFIKSKHVFSPWSLMNIKPVVCKDEKVSPVSSTGLLGCRFSNFLPCVKLFFQTLSWLFQIYCRPPQYIKYQFESSMNINSSPLYFFLLYCSNTFTNFNIHTVIK